MQNHQGASKFSLNPSAVMDESAHVGGIILLAPAEGSGQCVYLDQAQLYACTLNQFVY
jgi:hypothetical protein